MPSTRTRSLYSVVATPRHTPGVHPESEFSKLEGYHYSVKPVRGRIAIRIKKEMGVRLYADESIAQLAADNANAL